MSNEKNKKKKVKIFTKKKKHNEPESEFINQLQEKYGEELDLSNIKSFGDFPLSPRTLKGLKSSGYNKPTDIQKETLMLALNGKDILGAAQTGSGKTLAFLIPILEKLFCKQWTHLDGLGALVITPTRELAYQIFETLRKVGAQHDFSAGLIIGGKDLKFERNRMHQCNIVICTPGRLLQHMDENPLFDAVNLQILVLDEADRCLDMGFKETMNAIIANLPPKRQTLLFSATQTKSVKDLARLSLKDPSYIAVHENAKYSTPLGLQQSYVECELKDKVSMIWSFIKNHLKKKCIIFVSTCKQAKYMCEIFSKLRPGTSLMALYGTLHQLRRMNIYESFARKSSAVLFATDLAARGLDFPEVHWVVQMDCPEDSDTYIHRVGRTARYYKGGESLLLLMPSEIQMLEELAAKRIPIEKTEINPLKLNNPVKKMKTFLTTNTALKESARRAFMNYAKAVAHMKNKKIFNVDALDTDSFSESLGLTVPPRIRFLERMNKKKIDEAKSEKPNPQKTYFEDGNEFSADQNEPTVDNFTNKSEEMDSSDDDIDREDTDTKNSRLSGDESGDDFSLFYVDSEKEHLKKSRPKDFNLNETSYERVNSISKKAKTKAQMVRQILKKNIVPNKKIVFNENGDQVIQTNKESKSQLAVEYDNEESDIDIEKLKAVLIEQDKLDRERDRERVKFKHREVKRKLKEKKKKEKEEEEGEKDDFGEDESEDEPDLSWLPDPDKVYGKKDDDEVSDSDFKRSNIDETDNVALEVDTKVLKKKKSWKRKTAESKEVPKKKRKRLDQIKELTTTLSVNEAEELALVLLGK